MTAPRKWLAAISSPTRGVIAMDPTAWDRFPDTTERVWVQEVLPEEDAPAPAAELAPAPASEPVQAVDTTAAVDAAMTELARELGCAHSDLIPHNSGLFIPGEPKACPNPAEAIRRLFAYVRAGGLVHRPLPPEVLASLQPPAAEPPRRARPEVDDNQEAAMQGGLF